MSIAEKDCYDSSISDIIVAYKAALQASKSGDLKSSEIGKDITSSLERGLRFLVATTSDLNRERFRDAQRSAGIQRGG